MLKKIILSVILVLSSMLVLGTNINRYEAKASSSNIISSDTTLNSDIVITEDNSSGDYFTIMAGVVLTVDSITVSGSASLGSLFRVKNGGSLVINDLTVSSGLNITTIIVNFGDVYIKKLRVNCNAMGDIYNDSDNCIIEDVNISRITLVSGYLTVNENTKLEKQISVDCLESKQSVPSLVVKGDGVYASYFMDKFAYCGSYKYVNTSNPLDTTQYPAYFDYVGSIDKVKSNKVDTLSSVGLSTGDIILTAKTGTYTDASSNIISLAGRYTTMNDYLSSDDYTGGTYMFRSGLYDNNVKVALDNYHIAVSTGAVSSFEEVIDSNLALTVDSYLNSTKVNTSVYDKVGLGGSWLVFVDKVTPDYTINKTENIAYTTLYDCASHIALLVSHSGTGLTATLGVSFVEDVTISVSAQLRVDSFEYNGRNRCDDIEAFFVHGGVEYPLCVNGASMISVGQYSVELYHTDPQYIVNNSILTVYITAKEISLDYSQTSSVYTGESIVVSATSSGVITGDDLGLSLTNNSQVSVGTYTVNASITNSNYVLADESKTYNFVIDKATIDESLIAFEDVVEEYSGIGVLPNLSGVDDRIVEVIYDYDDIDIVSVGTHIVKAYLSVINTNYYNLHTTEYQATVTILPKGIIPSLVGVEIEYSGDQPHLEFNFDGLVGEEWVYLDFVLPAEFSVGDYNIDVSIDLTDGYGANYKIKDGYESLSYSIVKATVDMSGISYDDCTIPYSGITYIPEVIGVPDCVKVDYESENDIFKLGTHTITARFSLYDTYNYNPLSVTSISMTLTVVPAEIDVEEVVMDNLTVDYDGEAHGLIIENLPENVSVSPVMPTYTNVGTYNITVTLVPVSSNYVLVGRDSMTLTATLTINAIDYDLSGVVCEDTTVTYDGEEHTILFTGTLPDGLTANTLVKKVNVGSYDIELSFVSANDNYNLPSPITKKLTILPKVITISLVRDSFTYTGEEFTVEYTLVGVCDGDTVEVVLLNNKNSQASNYVATVDSISNSNYTLDKNSLPYTIAKANINMSGISLPNKEIEYFGAVYTPAITGTLPTGVTCSITHSEIKNVGTYNIVASFTVGDNYNKPSDLTAVITVLPKPVVVQFSNHLNLMYTGETQYISVSVVGMIVEEEYTVVYSAEPREVGEYMCEVILAADSNYTIPGDTRCYFDIHTDHKTFSDDNYVLNVTNGMFKASNEVYVDKITLDTSVFGRINALHTDIAFVDSLKIMSDHGESAVSVSLELKDLNLKNAKHITVYSLNTEGQLIKVNYQVVGNALQFSALPNSSFVIVQDRVDNSIMRLVIVVLALFVVVLAFSLVMAIRNGRQKKLKSQIK